MLRMKQPEKILFFPIIKTDSVRKKHEIIIDFLCKTNIYNNEILWNIIASCKNKRVTDK